MPKSNTPRQHTVDIPFSAILHTMSLPLVAVDARGNVAYANPAAAAAFGFSAEVMHGRRAVRLFPGLDLESDGSGRIVPWEHPEHGRFLVRRDPVPQAEEGEGLVLHFVPEAEACIPCVPVEETEAYRTLKEHAEAVFHASSDGIWLTDGEGVVLDINRTSENLNRIEADQVRGRHMRDLVKEGFVDLSATLEVIRKKRRVSVLQEVRRTGRQLIVTGTPTFDAEGNISLVVLNERDITDLNDLRSTLAKTRKAKERVEEELTGLTLMELKKGRVVAESPAMRKSLATAQRLAQFETSEILLTGESGTGKGLMAKFIHDSSPRREKPFIQVNCATIPETLFEAELFGYERGAFTGASRSGKSGLLELATGGTFFLDEVGEIPLDMQAKLLKCLDDHEYYPLGASEPRRVDCIIVAATNRDLEALVNAKRFRRDLLYRLNTFTVKIPPLRQHREDIFELANHYLKLFNATFRSDKRIGPAGMALLQNQHYPGNVRELIGIIKKAVVICEEDNLDGYFQDLFAGGVEEEPQTTSMTDELARLERRLLRQARSACNTTREMADYLGVSQPTVVRKLKRYGLSNA